MPTIEFYDLDKSNNSDPELQLKVHDKKTTFGSLRQDIYYSQGYNVIINPALSDDTKIGSLQSENYFVNTHVFYVLRSDQQLRLFENDKTIEDALNQGAPDCNTLKIYIKPFEKDAHPFFSHPTFARNTEEEWESLLRVLQNSHVRNTVPLIYSDPDEQKDAWVTLAEESQDQRKKQSNAETQKIKARPSAIYRNASSTNTEQALREHSSDSEEKKCCGCRWRLWM